VKKLSYLQQAGCLLVCLLLAGCGGEPYAYQPDNELKPGPGLFSGDDGEFTLIGSPRNQEESESEEDSPEAAE
jgi:hypothetical protein